MNWEPFKLRGLQKVKWEIVKLKWIHNLWYWLVWLTADAYVVSYPRSGRTWMKTMLSKVLEETYNLKKHNIDLYKMTWGTPAPNIVFEHPLCSDYPTTNTLPSLYIPKKYKKMKVILLLRDPRDLVISNYFEYTTRKKVWQGTISEFIRKPFGTGRIIEFMNLWGKAALASPQKFLICNYEFTKSNPEAQLKRVCKFLNLPTGEETINNAVRFGSVENMRKLESQDYFKNDKIRPADKDNPESYKVRKAKVGGYKEYLNEEDIKYINELIKTKLIPNLGCGNGLGKQ